MIFDLWYDLESYEVKELHKADVPNRVTNIMVCDAEKRLSTLFVSDGKACQFDGKIIN